MKDHFIPTVLFFDSSFFSRSLHAGQGYLTVWKELNYHQDEYYSSPRWFLKETSDLNLRKRILTNLEEWKGKWNSSHWQSQDDESCLCINIGRPLGKGPWPHRVLFPKQFTLDAPAPMPSSKEVQSSKMEIFDQPFSSPWVLSLRKTMNLPLRQKGCLWDFARASVSFPGCGSWGGNILFLSGRGIMK